ncbi:MAG: hypothetical protein ABR532_08430 [Candidatus Dormibacteria bacterium]
MKPRCMFCDLPGDGMLFIPELGKLHHDCRAFLAERPLGWCLPVSQRREALDTWLWGPLRREIEQAAAARVGQPDTGPCPFVGLRKQHYAMKQEAQEAVRLLTCRGASGLVVYHCKGCGQGFCVGHSDHMAKFNRRAM